MTQEEKAAFDAMRAALESCKVEAVVNRKLEWFEVKVFNKELVRDALAAAYAVAEQGPQGPQPMPDLTTLIANGAKA